MSKIFYSKIQDIKKVLSDDFHFSFSEKMMKTGNKALGFLSRGAFQEMERIRREKRCGRFEAIFNGKMVTVKIQTVKGLRVEIFRACEKNTTQLLTASIGGTTGAQGCFMKNNKK